MSNKFRLSSGGQINRSEKISFKFNGKTFFGFRGDTLASALLANGVYLDFPSGDSIDVECYIWGKTYKQEKGSEDSLKVSLSTRIITDFLIYEAY